jgi:ribosome-binding protein aMBF1 (putative translation factor)
MSVSDVIKKETIENINQIENKKSEETESDSISQVLKNNTHKFTKKLESQLPLKMQQFSELYTAYLHSVNNTFDSCTTCEKELSEKLGMDKGLIKAFGKYTKVCTDSMLQQMDYYAQFRKYSTEAHLSAMKSCDNFMTSVIGYNLKIFDQFK